MIRRYTAQEVAPAIIDELLEAAIHAPSPHNRQPWRFAIVKGDARYTLARAMGNQLRAELTHDGVKAETIELDVGRSYQRITTAPAAILACMSMRDMDVYPDNRRAIAERWMAGQAVSAAIQNILLRATELGIGACWMCAPLFCQSLVKETLRLPGDWEPQALITLGYPADAGQERGRLRLDEVSVTVSTCV
jgi:coenzyme F420-0:L-glutamate ligase/coenzyme F420-1:gamma-L-glutamate ligase